MRAIRVLHVCDGGAAGGATAAALGADPVIELVGRAGDVAQASAMLAQAAPDVLVLYAVGPGGPARCALERAAAARGTAMVLIGPASGVAESFEGLRARVRDAAGLEADVAPVEAARPPLAPRAGAPARRRAARPAGPPKLIAIGASTGGVEALVQVLSGFPRMCPPTIVVQHMPAFFTTSFAARLDGVCQPSVHEAWDGAPLERGVVYIAPGGARHLEIRWSSERRCRLVESPPVNRHRPSVDVAFRSVALSVAGGAVGVLLTGMGRDGAQGLLEMREAGARTLAQDRDSSTVYGMPRAALENGAVDVGTPLNRIAEAIFTSEAPQKEAV